MLSFEEKKIKTCLFDSSKNTKIGYFTFSKMSQ